uniref:polymorphic toxin-type HINT domain-containing protein n=1 Tax=Streptomyces hawaiiensis TaxID=67305 RepID=UPI0031D9E6F0
MQHGAAQFERIGGLSRRLWDSFQDWRKSSKAADEATAATDGHPFWVPELGEWVDAVDLKAGEWLRTRAGSHVQVASVQRWTTGLATVHNLTVRDLHTYYVVGGDRSLLVHNMGGRKPGRRPNYDAQRPSCYVRAPRWNGADQEVCRVGAAVQPAESGSFRTREEVRSRRARAYECGRYGSGNASHQSSERG